MTVFGGVPEGFGKMDCSSYCLLAGVVRFEHQGQST
jgi:hypothetical protein